jgi:hypothetical protein
MFGALAWGYKYQACKAVHSWLLQLSDNELVHFVPTSLSPTLEYLWPPTTTNTDLKHPPSDLIFSPSTKHAQTSPPYSRRTALCSARRPSTTSPKVLYTSLIPLQGSQGFLFTYLEYVGTPSVYRSDARNPRLFGSLSFFRLLLISVISGILRIFDLRCNSVILWPTL